MSLKALKKGKKLSPLNLSNNKQPNYVPNGTLKRMGALYNPKGNAMFAALDNKSQHAIRNKQWQWRTRGWNANSTITNGNTPGVTYNIVRKWENRNDPMVEHAIAYESPKQGIAWRNSSLPALGNAPNKKINYEFVPPIFQSNIDERIKREEKRKREEAARPPPKTQREIELEKIANKVNKDLLEKMEEKRKHMPKTQQQYNEEKKWLENHLLPIPSGGTRRRRRSKRSKRSRRH